MKQTYLHTIRYGLAALFVSYVAFVSLFTHSHVVNGVAIVHSHPFDKDGEHHHTEAEFQLIHSLSNIEIDQAISPSFSFTPFLLQETPLPVPACVQVETRY
ncbi:MAG: hypothetical protein LUD15_05635 [Bacteroides sp.]|nr:hypothetical protein [Bacteroides sp.]